MLSGRCGNQWSHHRVSDKVLQDSQVNLWHVIIIHHSIMIIKHCRCAFKTADGYDDTFVIYEL